MTDVALTNAERLQIDCLVALGGNGTQKNALRLSQKGLPVITLPKTIDNDVWGTDMSFGFDTAMNIATEAIDRLHTTATSHHRIIVCEIMGHSAGWLALGSGIAGGADVILIPEIPYKVEVVAEHLVQRRRTGRRFSIIAVAEGARSEGEAAIADDSDDAQETVALENQAAAIKKAKKKRKKENADSMWTATEEGHPLVREPMASRLARDVQRITGVEARVTSLGHVQRGGSPTSTDRLLCTRLGTAAAHLLLDGKFNCMVAVKGDEISTVPLSETAGKTKKVPVNHEWIETARLVETCMGDR
jgi:6-phosphofructokinase 1